MSKVFRDSALVVKRKTLSVLLLIIKKKWVLGKLRCTDIPSVGEVIMIDWRSTGGCDTIDICSWNNYEEAMGGFVVSEPTEAGTKFTGMFYTMGRIIYGGVALENPAVFNNIIGVVQDTANVLNKNYIGKLRATVSFDEDCDGCHWALISVDEYLKKGDSEIPDQKRPFKGVVGAINQGPSRAVNYITTRYFPHDVRFFTWRNVDPKLLYNLLGREVSFAASKDPRSKNGTCVTGIVEPTKTNNFNISREGDFFKVELAVEYIGCTDEHGCILVWSDLVEFVVDNKRLFKDREYGIYHIYAARHYHKLQFAKWNVKYVGRLIKPIGGHISRFKCISTALSRQSTRQSEGNYNRIRNRSVEYGADEKPDKLPRSRSKHESGVRNVIEDKGCSKTHAAASEECSEEVKHSPKENAKAKDSRTSASSLCSRDGKSTPKEDVEETLRTCFHRCLESVKVRAAIKQADPKFFNSLVATLMSVE
nr:hypothetical protein HCOI_01624400 [Haemonchus contortus]